MTLSAIADLSYWWTVERADKGAGDAVIAIDWGTSNRRAFLLDAHGKVLDVERDAVGALSVARNGFPAEVEGLRRRFGARRVVAAGMVGSTRGWVDVPYVPAPADAAAVARGVVRPADDVVILPGLSLTTDARCDVMRGEETQVLGALALGAGDGLFCQPGTHSKWIEVRSGRIATFVTAMTGELFGLLRAGGVLAGMLDGPVMVDEHFRAGLAAGADGRDLAASLFGVRAQVLLGRRAAGGAAAYASGVLIGADVGARGDLAGREVRLLGSGPLAALYAAAIERAGGVVAPIDAEAAFVAGIMTVEGLLD